MQYISQDAILQVLDILQASAELSYGVSMVTFGGDGSDITVTYDKDADTFEVCNGDIVKHYDDIYECSEVIIAMYI